MTVRFAMSNVSKIGVTVLHSTLQGVTLPINYIKLSQIHGVNIQCRYDSIKSLYGLGNYANFRSMFYLCNSQLKMGIANI